MRVRLELRENGRLAVSGVELPISTRLQTGCAWVFAVPFGLLFLLMLFIAGIMALDGDAYSALQALIFGLVMGGIGFAPLIWLFWARRRARERPLHDSEPWHKLGDRRTDTLKEEAPPAAQHTTPPVLKSEYGEEPWLHRKAWITRRIASNRKGDKAGRWLVLFGSAWLAMTAGAALLYANGFGEGGSPALFIIFALMGMPVLGIGVYRVLRSRKYRHVMLEMDEVPGALGGSIAGRLETDIPITGHPEDGFSVRLSCYRRRVLRDSEGKNSVDHTLLWRDETRMQAQPYGGPSENPYAEAELRRDMSAPVSPGITMRQTAAGGTEFYFGPARHKGAALMLTAAFGVMAVITPVALLSRSIMGALVLLVFAGVTGYGAWHYWTQAGRMTIERGAITVRSGPFAWGREHFLRCVALERVEVATRVDGRYDLQLVRGDMSEAQKVAAKQEKLEQAERIEGWLRAVGLVGRRGPGDGPLKENLKQHGMRGDTIKAAEALPDRRSDRKASRNAR